MSRKTIAFSMPATARGEAAGAGARRPAPDLMIEAGSDDWVSDRNVRAEETSARAAGPSLILDLAAERSLIEVMALSCLAPFALGWFWLVNAMAGRMRL